MQKFEVPRCFLLLTDTKRACPKLALYVSKSVNQKELCDGRTRMRCHVVRCRHATIFSHDLVIIRFANTDKMMLDVSLYFFSDFSFLFSAKLIIIFRKSNEIIVISSRGISGDHEMEFYKPNPRFQALKMVNLTLKT